MKDVIDLLRVKEETKEETKEDIEEDKVPLPHTIYPTLPPGFIPEDEDDYYDEDDEDDY